MIADLLGAKAERLRSPISTIFTLSAGETQQFIGQQTVQHGGLLWLSRLAGISYLPAGEHERVTLAITGEADGQQWQYVIDDQVITRRLTVREGRLWHLLGSRAAMIYHLQAWPDGGVEIIGGTLRLNGWTVPQRGTPALIRQLWPLSADSFKIQTRVMHPFFGMLYESQGQFQQV